MTEDDCSPTTETLVNDLRQVGDIVRRPPDKKDIQNHGNHQYEEYTSEFRAFEAALDEAGYNVPAQLERDVPTRDDLIASLRDIFTEVSRVPRVADIPEYSEYRYSNYRSEFENWYAALVEAGLENKFIGRVGHGMKGDDLLIALQKLGEKVGEVPNSSDLKRRSPHDPDTYVRNYESVSIATALAGFENQPERPPTEISDGELLGDIAEVRESVEQPPTSNDYREFGRFSFQTILTRFGTWNEALHEATGEAPSDGRSIGDEELISDLRAVSTRLQGTPRYGDIQEFSKYSISAYYRHFSSIENIRNVAGIPSSDTPSDADSEESLVWYVIWFLNYTGDIPSAEEMATHQPEFHQQCRETFGDWESTVSKAQETVAEILE
ncbi:hypothetical protein [Halobacterium sp. R2-5]|uniref:homing endonuclease associated repeat-containing protein n=1 Tax=Halobacterium sp. R2-5 TaxID=2715751 RepID=UPI001421A26F|nr:hypothetical protein [Halobacterium sp. R2-5]NIC00923.1 hypothetical protein [Halobacterium sp. R2-5]